jgi:hypothetical protein
MKGPFLPPSAKTGSPQPLPYKDRHAWDSCSLSSGVLLAQATLLGIVTRVFWAAWSLSQEKPPGIPLV